MIEEKPRFAADPSGVEDFGWYYLPRVLCAGCGADLSAKEPCRKPDECAWVRRIAQPKPTDSNSHCASRS